jgi:hypothetical protein
VVNTTSGDIMNPKTKLILGSILTILGGFGIIFGPIFKLTELASPWSFIVGFLTGLFAGLGVALSISGLMSRKKIY